MSSSTMVIHPIIAALVESEKILGPYRDWNAVNKTQKRLLADYFLERLELSKFSKKELRSWVSWVAAELNEILAKEGFSIRLEDFGKQEFGVVSILDVLVEWLVKGEKTQIYFEGRKYPAVKIAQENFQAYDSARHPHPLAMLHTKSGDKVYMTIVDKPHQDFGLVSRIDEIRAPLRKRVQRYGSLRFPMVNLNHEVDISWLKGLSTTDENTGLEVYLSQALQQTRLKMNETGVRVKSAVAVGMRFVAALPLQPLVIDRPFFLWIERPGLSIPVMYAYIDEKDWKDPGNLDM